MTSSSVGKGIAISGMFFMLGLCFGSLSSRMATIKDGLQLSDGVFGSALFAMSAGVVLSLPVSGWMIAKLGSRNVGVTAILANAVLLLLVPLASSVYQLAALLFVSGFSYSEYPGKPVGGAHRKDRVTVFPRYMGVGGIRRRRVRGVDDRAGLCLVHAFRRDIGDRLPGRPGLLALSPRPAWRGAGRAGLHDAGQEAFQLRADRFFSMACEGIMYDWSVVYFQDVVSAERQLVGVGFMVFMGAMTVGRLLLNRVADRFGTRSTLQWSGGSP
ncbi:hypothetical protein NMC42_11815 [Pseudomonas aeruginosa]